MSESEPHTDPQIEVVANAHGELRTVKLLLSHSTAIKATTAEPGEVALQFLGSGMVPQYVNGETLRRWALRVVALCEDIRERRTEVTA